VNLKRYFGSPIRPGPPGKNGAEWWDQNVRVPRTLRDLQRMRALSTTRDAEEPVSTAVRAYALNADFGPNHTSRGWNCGDRSLAPPKQSHRRQQAITAETNKPVNACRAVMPAAIADKTLSTESPPNRTTARPTERGTAQSGRNCQNTIDNGKSNRPPPDHHRPGQRGPVGSHG